MTIQTSTTGRAQYFVRDEGLLSRLGGPGFRECELPAAEARKLKATPAVTAILSTILKNGLQRSDRRRFFDTLLGRLRPRDESREQFVLKRYRETQRANATAGDRALALVRACERWTRTGRYPLDDLRPGVEAFAEFCRTHELQVIASGEVVRTAEFAGRVDFVAQMTTSNGDSEEVLVDLRLGREDAESFDFYIGMGVELAAKALARARGRSPRPRIVTLGFPAGRPEAMAVRWWSRGEQSQFERIFAAARQLWQAAQTSGSMAA